ncbi:LysR substrate-binding domain-containing protein [Actinoplanes sp. NBRC 101535]|uniref:LysR substrate-binding domain-containing protein n=1 Tax=Actinoplanes sp. NBRC 101535 TaxID=3032196 RepID=UPI0024A25987|nr:LysR substrate-binding domain-containing protein [Actinoplanes sp. NBRC 101535]GLY03969.1 LysR family transcriptional regulator [Actinoplanes sp. NBRC 101535]
MDLNLLTGLDALLEHRSVQGAAAQLHLTQPAVSRILARLRASTGDEILVRNGRHMVPTARALELRDEVRDLVTRAGAVLTPARDLDLTTLSRVFTVRLHDSFLAALGPPLVRAVVDAAPGVVLRLVGEDQGESRELSRGAVDVTVGCVPASESASIVTRTLGTDPMVLIVAEGHPADVAQPTAEQLAGALFVDVSRDEGTTGPIDRLLAERGLSRRVVATVPTVAAAIAIAATGVAVTVLPQRLRDPMPARLRSRPLPFPLTTPPATVSWHRRHAGDPAHTWLRDLTTKLVAAILGPAKPPTE